MANGEGGKLAGTVALAQHVTRPLVTLFLVAGFCWGFYFGKVSGETYAAIVATVVGFWFGQRSGEARSNDRAALETGGGATATAPQSGGTATATVTPSQSRGD